MYRYRVEMELSHCRMSCHRLACCVLVSFGILVGVGLHLGHGFPLEHDTPGYNHLTIRLSRFGVGLQYCQSLVYQVKGCMDHGLTLQEKNGKALVKYLIGGWFNSHSMFMFKNPDRKFNKKYTPNILHCSQYRSFWVRWGYGRIAIGKGNILGWDILYDEEDVTGNVSILNVGQTSYNGNPYRIRLGDQERGRFKPEVGTVKWKDGLIIRKKVHLIQCSVACFQHVDCGMFSHNKGQGICELFNRTSSTFTVTSQNGWKSWKLLYC